MVWVTVVVTFYLWLRDIYGFMDALRISCFNIVSVLTTTGFGLGDFGTWGPLTSIIFIILLALGACSGSTAGGLKIFRVQVAFALFKKQMRQLMHPSGVFPQKYNGPVNDAIIRSMISFVLAYFAVILLIAALLAAIGLDPDRHLGLHHRRGQRGSGHGADHRPQHQLRHPAGLGQVDPVVRHAAGTARILTVAVLFFPPSGSSNQRAREIEWRRVSRRRNAEGQPLAALLIA